MYFLPLVTTPTKPLQKAWVLNDALSGIAFKLTSSSSRNSLHFYPSFFVTLVTIKIKKARERVWNKTKQNKTTQFGFGAIAALKETSECVLERERERERERVSEEEEGRGGEEASWVGWHRRHSRHSTLWSLRRSPSQWLFPTAIPQRAAPWRQGRESRWRRYE